MAGRCKICSDTRVAEIDAALAKIGTRKTARQFTISLPALDRHKRHSAEKQLSVARTPEDVLSTLGQLLTDALRGKDASTREKVNSCIRALGKMLEQGASVRKQERNLDLEIAQLVSDATLGFDPQEIGRLRALLAVRDKNGLLHETGSETSRIVSATM
jgi:hypothetical protein